MLLLDQGLPRTTTLHLRNLGLKAEQLADLLVRVLEQAGDDLKSGAMVTVTESSVRIRHLPLVRL